MADDGANCPGCGVPADLRDALLTASAASGAIPMRDPETGVLNRPLLLEAVTPVVALARRNARTMAFLHIHLEGLAVRAALLPDACGSALLREVTEQVLGIVRDSDFVARVGPDRFAVVLTEVWESDGAARVASRLSRALDEATDVLGQAPRVGVSFFPADGAGVDELLGAARAAAARVPARGGVAFANPVMGAEALRQAGLERDLTGLDASSQFLLHYQPIFSLATGAVVGVESLMRWNHAVHGLLTAADFIPMAERTGRIRALDQWAVTRAMEDASVWKDRGWDGWVSVNLSGRTLSDVSLVDHVESSLARTQVEPGSLIFEVTESTALAGNGNAAGVLEALRDLGSRIAIDDFGTGYASFEYLRDFDPDLVKLDQVFVTGHDHARADRLLRSLVLMAHHMGKPVVVEGVEEESQRERLLDSECDMVQGFLLGRPVAAEVFAELHLGAPAGGTPEFRPGSSF